MERVKIANENQMTENRRQMFLRVMDGIPDLVGTMHILHGYVYCDNFLKWLYDNKITGKELAEFLTKNFQGSVPKMVDFICEKINRSNVKLKGEPILFDNH